MASAELFVMVCNKNDTTTSRLLDHSRFEDYLHSAGFPTLIDRLLRCTVMHYFYFFNFVLGVL